MKRTRTRRMSIPQVQKEQNKRIEKALKKASCHKDSVKGVTVQSLKVMAK
jgi:hypothetical protein